MASHRCVGEFAGKELMALRVGYLKEARSDFATSAVGEGPSPCAEMRRSVCDAVEGTVSRLSEVFKPLRLLARLARQGGRRGGNETSPA